MQKQKRGFWLFIFSLIPGAGEMYMGFKKQGISIMFLFWGVFAIGACTGMDWLVFLIPIIWFYSFFNVHNLKSLSEEEFYSIEDSYVLHMDELAGDISSLLKHHGKITAILLIFLGASILWNTLVDFLYMILPGYLADVIGRFTYHLPQLVIAAAIILQEFIFSPARRMHWMKNSLTALLRKNITGHLIVRISRMFRIWKLTRLKIPQTQ